MMGKKTEFTKEQCAEIKRRLGLRQSYRKIAREMPVGYEAMRRQFDVTYRDHRNQRHRNVRETYGPRYGDAPAELVRTVETPACVLADRMHRRALSRPTLTAEFFGDPLPGYSALDRRQQT